MSIETKNLLPKPGKSFSLAKVVNEHFSGIEKMTFVQTFYVCLVMATNIEKCIK